MHVHVRVSVNGTKCKCQLFKNLLGQLSCTQFSAVTALQHLGQPSHWMSYRIWVSYLNPIFWTVYGLIESQVDNLDVEVQLNSGVSVPAYQAVEMIFGYQ